MSGSTTNCSVGELVLQLGACCFLSFRLLNNDLFYHTPQYVLHKVLPQPRESSVNDSDEQLKLKAYTKTKLSQAGARLIVCLVARSGEGRRRVIADLVFALSSCGQHSVENSSQEK